MNKNDIYSLDLNLLGVFHLLMQERSVTATARRLRLGQPAVSRSLARLRELSNDPLFVRAGRTLEATPRALALHAQVRPALEAIEHALRAGDGFDPKSTERIFQLAMSDDIQLSFLPDICERLSAIMPKARLIVQHTDYLRAGSLLESGTASIAVGYLNKLPANAKVTKLARVGYRALTCQAAEPMTSLPQYCASAHVLVTFAGDLIGYVDETLSAKGLERRIVLSLSTFSVLPFVLQDTGRVATVPHHVAQTLSLNGPLRSSALPFTSPEFDLTMAWRLATDRDPAEMLLRQIIQDVVVSRFRGG
ncbi:MAG: LysR family transcriptional regulator [Pseudomonadota bacterium]